MFELFGCCMKDPFPHEKGYAAITKFIMLNQLDPTNLYLGYKCVY